MSSSTVLTRHKYPICSKYLVAAWLLAVLSFGLATKGLAEDSTVAASWAFGAEESTPLELHGGVKRDQPGPRSPTFPAFGEGNTAVYIDGKGSHLSIKDTGDNSKYDFANGDAMTIEAWVKIDSANDLADAKYMYVIGKGRTSTPRAASTQTSNDAHNWSLRLKMTSGKAQLSFLFSTSGETGKARWHRWTSGNGFSPTTDWHHIAISYRFGEPDSMRGWIDGLPAAGFWDMGGATSAPPSVDNNAIWIGSSRGGHLENSFCGWIDEVALHRVAKDDAYMSGQFERLGGPQVMELAAKEIMPDMGDIPPGQVLLTLGEGMPTRKRWLHTGENWPTESMRWTGDHFLLSQLPIKHDDWGIRDAWSSPTLLRMAADVQLPEGSSQLLLHTRGLSRLWIDGTLVARSDFVSKPSRDGEEPMTPVIEPLEPGIRAPRFGQRAVTGEWNAVTSNSESGRLSRVVLEVIVGGKGQRTEPGETCVAIKPEGAGSFQLLLPTSKQPVDSIPFDDVAIEAMLPSVAKGIAQVDETNRRAKASSMDAYWNERHSFARTIAKQQLPDTPIPAIKGETQHPIDLLLGQHIDRALEASAKSDLEQAAHFHSKVLSILRQHCFRCHNEKANGGLRVDQLETLMKGGDSEIPGVVPHHPEESELLVRIRDDDESTRMPPTGAMLSEEEVEVLSKWVKDGAAWYALPLTPKDIKPTAPLNDERFLRRVYLDLVGVLPSAETISSFCADTNVNKRSALVDRLLEDDRYADQWISYWLDVLAENPTLLNHSLNSTGPFRWYLYDALRDNKPIDRMVTELIMMRGNPYEGGTAGFELAFENDAPYAAKGSILASTFMGINTQCARCHDAPFHETTQEGLYSIAAMLERKPCVVPDSNRVPLAFMEKQGRSSLIQANLGPDDQVLPDWPFEEVAGVALGEQIDRFLLNPKDTREQLAALITSPENTRFARVVVNHLWKRLVGVGFVEPVNDWEGKEVSHQETLDWLARELVANSYDKKHIIRLILTSDIYQREADQSQAATSGRQFFHAPRQRRMSAEQVVDSLHVALGVAMDSEEMTFIHDGRRPMSKRLTLGNPQRGWMFASLNNERDRPSLALPRAQAVVNVMQAFGWTGSRQEAIHQREAGSNVLQPGILSNGVLTSNLTRASKGSTLSKLAVEAKSPEQLVDELFLRTLSRKAGAEERKAFDAALAEGFDDRLVPTDQQVAPESEVPLELVTWQNHLQPEANLIQQENERRVRKGPPVDPRIRPEWREVYEDFVWGLINHPEFVWIP